MMGVHCIPCETVSGFKNVYVGHFPTVMVMKVPEDLKHLKKFMA